MKKRSLTIEQIILEEKNLIPDVNIMVTSHCNLNCISCMNFSSLAKPSFLDINQFEKDMKQLSKIAKGKIARIDLMGGEPLLHPEIITIMQIARKYFSKINIAIETNGILLTKMNNEFWQTCKNCGIIVRVSNYPSINSIEHLKQFAYNENAVFRVNETPEDWMQKKSSKLIIETNGGSLDWQKFPFDMNGMQNPQKNYNICEQHCCTALVDGKFFPCTKIPNIEHYNAFFNTNIHISDNDYIDIYSLKNSDALFQFLSKPVDFCKFCNLKKNKQIKWQLGKKEKSEWLP